MEKLKKNRSATRGWVTRLGNTIGELLTKTPVDYFELRDTVEDLEVRLLNLDRVQEEVEGLLEPADLEADLDESSSFRKKAKRPLLDGRKALQQNDVEDKLNTSHSTSGSSKQASAKLPKLELPKFSGNVMEWPSFWDKYSSIVHTSEMSGVSKFTYLQSLLQGEAKAALEGLSVTDAHYEHACQLLEERFGRRERIIFAHIQGLLNISARQSQGSSVATLRQLQDGLMAHVRSLESLGITGDAFGVFMTPLILSRLPQELRMEWARDGEGKESDLAWLLQFLKKEIDRRERSETFSEMNGLKQTRSFNDEKKQRTSSTASEEKRSKTYGSSPATAAALQVSVENSCGSCGICKKQHATDKCFELTKKDWSARRDAIQIAELCFRCLNAGHRALGCNSKCAKCNGRHHQILCQGGVSQQGKAGDSSVSHVGVSHQVRSNRCTVLNTAQVLVKGKAGIVKATLLLDSGADRSYISVNLARQIEPQLLCTETVTYAAFGGNKSKGQLRNVYKLKLSGVDTQDTDHELTVVEVPVISSPMRRQAVPSDILQKFGNLPLADDYGENRQVSVDLLIGQDYYWSFFKQGQIRISEGLAAQETVVGWVVSGSWASQQNSYGQQSQQFLCLDDLPESTLRSFWDLESIGIKAVEDVQDSHPVLVQFNQSVKFVEGRYEVALPWKNSFVQGRTILVDNFDRVKGRFHSLNRKLKQNVQLQESYNKVFKDMEDSGIIEEVPVDELRTKNPVFYLPHRPIVREDSITTRVRPVFDASAVGYNGVSLNDCVETGPSLIPSLPEILIRFRRWRVALIGDISKAFLQIKVRKEDQDVHRFLWDVNGSVRIMKFLRVPFGNRSSPFLLNATIKHHVAQIEVTTGSSDKS